jgi:hypothetical protein
MIVNDLDVHGSGGGPSKADTVLAILCGWNIARSACHAVLRGDLPEECGDCPADEL